MMRLTVVAAAVAAAGMLLPAPAVAQTWNNAGLPQATIDTPPVSPAPAPRRDLTGTWDAGREGITGVGHTDTAAPFTPWALEKLKTMRPGNGPRAVTEQLINDPLNTMCDPAGFPRIVLYEYRPFQVVQTPNQVLMFYMYEKRWRVIWTDGRALPTDPDPRWYGYSVGRWEDDSTFVVDTVGLDERTWLDNAGNPHSGDLRVQERYRRINRDVMELSVTIDDPKAYTRPWTPRDRLTLRLMPADTDLMEWVCAPSEASAFKDAVVTQYGVSGEKK
jgi:hypothetical protein